jgi:tetratricopeptide (TPR) repeat protein
MVFRKAVAVFLSVLLCGVTAARNQVWREPLSLWTDVVNKSPRKIRPYINLASAYIDGRDFDRALDVLFKTTKVFKDTLFSGNLYYVSAAVEIYTNFAVMYGAKGDLNMAEEFLLKALETSPTSAKTLYALGYLYIEKGDTRRAESFLQNAVSKGSEAKADFLYADLLEKSGKDREALEHMEKAVWFEPDNANFRNRLGILLRSNGRPDEAEKQWLEASRLAPLFAEPCINLGSLMYERGLVRKAYKHYRRALELAPGSYEALVGAGNAMDEMGNHPMAVETYGRAISADPRRPEAYVNLGIALERAGRKEEAREAYRNALRNDPKDRQAAAGLGRLGS